MSPFSVQFQEPLRGLRLAAASVSEEELARRLADGEQAAFERGRIEGGKAMAEQLRTQQAAMVQLQQGVLDSLRGAIPQVVRDSEQALVALALEVARKLVGGMPVSAEMVEAVVHEALAQVEETTDCHIHLHPDDCALLEQFNPSLTAGSSGPLRLHIHRSTDVARGGCLVKSRFGIVDAQRDTKIALLEKSLLE